MIFLNTGIKSKILLNENAYKTKTDMCVAFQRYTYQF